MLLVMQVFQMPGQHLGKVPCFVFFGGDGWIKRAVLVYGSARRIANQFPVGAVCQGLDKTFLFFQVNVQ